MIKIYSIEFNVSYSLISLFKSSQLQFYFDKISNVEGEKINSCYGDAGNVVHKALEEKIKNFGNERKKFEELWERYKLPCVGMFGEKFDKEKYRKMFENGIDIIDLWNQDYNLIPEEKIEFKLNVDGEKVKVKGYIDVVAQHPESKQVVLMDWKTNSSLPKGGFRYQQLFYTYLYYKKYGVVANRCMWFMLRSGNVVKHHFELEDVLKVEEEIKTFIRTVREYGKDINKYNEGDWDNPFNAYKSYCINEVRRRKNTNIINCEIKKNKIKLIDLMDEKLDKALDLRFSYFVDGYHFSELYKKRIWDGKSHMYKNKTVPIGYYHMLQTFIEKYNKHYNKDYKLIFNDMRDKDIKLQQWNTKFSKPPFKLRYYQEEAVEAGLHKKIGMLYLGTAAGKTAITAELLKRINKRSLLVINRLELVDQTAKEFSDYLGVEVGKMSEGNLCVDKQFTVASVQTLNAILKRKNDESKKLKQYLYNLNCMIFDECQNVTNTGFYSLISKYVINADYFIGTTGSPGRNDCHILKMKALVGDVIYSKSTEELEKEGWIVPTKSYFIRAPAEDWVNAESYADAYDFAIVKNKERNKIVVDLVNRYKSTKKILVLTKLIKHGKILNDMIDGSLLINSQVDNKQRKEDFKQFRDERGKVLISSAQIMSTGINIPDLDMIINTSATKSWVMTVQSIGRVKRKKEGKIEGYYIDFFDGDVEFFREASKVRMNVLKEYGNEAKIIYLPDEVKIN